MGNLTKLLFSTKPNLPQIFYVLLKLSTFQHNFILKLLNCVITNRYNETRNMQIIFIKLKNVNISYRYQMNQDRHS
jgi:hypothetical protein